MEQKSILTWFKGLAEGWKIAAGLIDIKENVR
jgi:hypothetical protein